MTDLETIIKLLAVAGGTIALVKAGWAVARFFVGLSEGLRNLTASVDKLAERFDAHAITIGELSERVAGLESWRTSAEGE